MITGRSNGVITISCCYIGPRAERQGHHAVNREPQVDVVGRQVQEILLAENRRELPRQIFRVLRAQAEGDDELCEGSKDLAHKHH